MSESNSNTRAWEITKSVILLLTPVLVAVMGYFFNRSLTKIEGQIANVEAMRPFMDMIADSSVTKSKMGAYAIYMLKKDDDPELAAQMILAAEKDHLLDVLYDLGTRDTVIRNKINSVFSNVQILDTTNLTDMQLNALEVSKKIEKQAIAEEALVEDNSERAPAKDWLYLGNFKSDPPSQWVVNEKLNLNSKGKTYTLIKDANVRRTKPQPPNYSLPAFVRVANAGEQIEIDTLTFDKKGHCWARVWFK